MSETRKPTLTGGCQCGAVRYALFAMPDRAGICHCRMCQKAVGGPFKAWANVRVQDLTWTRGTPSTFRSSSAAERGFCERCGTPLTFGYTQRPGTISVTIGSLDTPEAVALTQVDGIESRWASFDPAMLAALPARRSGEAGAPEDLSRITNFQHPDHDTPSDWQPPAVSA
ncbi:MAG TPA: GFA family protein [Acetobacteraceae bacterium]|jgi:hypothetical protein|nr:GFA family protein [Acetobacteraceae bacterium]